MTLIQRLWLLSARISAAAFGCLGRYFLRVRQISRLLRPEYVYTPLDASRREIRLCSITSGPDSDTIRVQLRTVCFNDCTNRYTCISYAWGDLERANPVLINGLRHTTTRNLCVILRRLRSLNIVGDVWIDALCIDQNESELSYQVGMMAEIYACAKEVYVGIETDHRADQLPQVALGSTVMDCLVENRHLDDLAVDRCTKTSVHDQFASLQQLLNSKWFTRAWTVQEVCLARKTKFLTAAGCFTWKEVACAFTNWNEHRKGCCSSIAISLEHDLRRWLYETYSHIQSINATVSALSAGQHIIKSLLYYQSMRSSNPVDKYFAFRGLHTYQSSVPLPLPDYHRSKEDTFTELARWLLEDQRSLLVLHIDLPDASQRCPSWVPDWSVESLTSPVHRRVRLAFLESYNAAKGLEMELTFPQPGSLHLRGIRIDEVGCVAADRFELDSTQSNQRVLNAWSRLVHPDNGNKEGGHETYGNDFCYALLGGCVVERGEPVREAHSSDIAQLRDFMASQDLDSSAYHTPVMSSHIAAVLERRCFRLKNGGFGLGPDSLQSGDEIWILAGGPAPFALRKVLSASMEPRYQLIGHCYVDMRGQAVDSGRPETGIMTGEAVDSGRLETCILI